MLDSRVVVPMVLRSGQNENTYDKANNEVWLVAPRLGVMLSFLVGYQMVDERW